MGEFDLKNWNVNQAIAANKEAVEEGRGSYDPDLPISESFASQRSEMHRENFEGGDNFSLMKVIADCARARIPIPEWAVPEILRAYYLVMIGEARTLDEAFGHPHKKGKHLNQFKQDRYLRFKVAERVREIRQLQPDVPIDDLLFEQVGNEFAICKSRANRLFYEYKRLTGAKLPRKTKNSRQ